MKALRMGFIFLVLIGIAVVGIGAEKAAVSREVQGISEAALIAQGPALIAEGNYKRILDMIAGLPEEARNNIQVRTLECFANLKGWLSTKNLGYKTNWWGLRMKLLYVGDRETTPLLVVFLKNGDPYMRKYAAELLGYVGDERALGVLQNAGRHDDNSGVRKYAKWAYKQISGGLTPATSGLGPLAAPRVQIPVTMEVAGPINTGNSIAFVNTTREFKIMPLGVVDTIEYKRYYADFESWGDIIVKQLEAELQKRDVRVMSPATGRVVIGVLDLEAGGTGKTPQGQKKALMEKVGQKLLVKVVNIPEYSNLADLKENGYEKAEGYKNKYQADMILHVNRVGAVYYFSLIDLYTKQASEVSMQTELGLVDELPLKKLSEEVLANQYLTRVLSAKRRVSGNHTVQATPPSDYIFKVSVRDVKLIEGVWATRCIVTVLVERGGGGWSHTYEGNTASSASAERAIDGAVYRVVEAIITDHSFRDALSQ